MTNDILKKSELNEVLSFDDKKSDNFLADAKSGISPLEQILIKNSFFKWNAKKKGNAEWFLRFFSFFLAITIPFLINKIIPYEHTYFKGLIGYSTFPLILYLFSQQKHRITHISAYIF